ncbi:MAG: hypothetical protein IJM10_10410 [Clostridia bacterium]|nr:hypothetical protein [Clostridia bacterium]
MAANELKKLNRRELLELLIGEMRESDRREAEIAHLNEKIEELKFELENVHINIENSGSLAEASLKLDGVFTAADEAAKRYTSEIRNRYREAMVRLSREYISLLNDKTARTFTRLTGELKAGVPLSQDEFENLVLRPLRQEYENGCSALVEQAKELLNIPGEKTE